LAAASTNKTPRERKQPGARKPILLAVPPTLQTPHPLLWQQQSSYDVIIGKVCLFVSLWILATGPLFPMARVSEGEEKKKRFGGKWMASLF